MIHRAIRRPIRTLAVVAFLCQELACSPATSAEPLPARSILFIGNSLTYTNDLPLMVEELARAAGDSIRIGTVAGPNMAVIDHTVPGAEAVTAIGQDEWSYVVLQQGPTPTGICRDTLVIAAMRLAPKIRAAGGRPVLFLPWTRRGFPQFLGIAGESATAAARAVGGVVAPVGIAWKHALQADADLPLYGPDGYHPAPEGTLLAAMTVYDRLSGQDVRRIPAAALAGIPGVTLSPAQLEALAAAAHTASVELPADPSQPIPADTTRLSPTGGPC
jgi:hypothetical protein